MSKGKGYFEVIDNNFWIITEGKTGMFVFQNFEDAVRHIFARKNGFELFVIEGGILYEFRFEKETFIVSSVPLIDLVKEWYRLTGREKAVERKYTQRPAGYHEDEKRARMGN